MKITLKSGEIVTTVGCRPLEFDKINGKRWHLVHYPIKGKGGRKLRAVIKVRDILSITKGGRNARPLK